MTSGTVHSVCYSFLRQKKRENIIWIQRKLTTLSTILTKSHQCIQLMPETAYLDDALRIFPVTLVGTVRYSKYLDPAAANLEDYAP